MAMTAKLLPGLALALTAMTGAWVAPAPAQVNEGIHRILAGQVEAWNRGDAKTWAQGFSEDADFINILGMRFQGRHDIQRRHAELFATAFQGSNVTITVVKIRVLTGSAAVVETVHELQTFVRLPRGIQPTEGSNVLRTRMSYVFTLEGGRWRILSAQNTAIAPASPAGDV